MKRYLLFFAVTFYTYTLMAQNVTNTRSTTVENVQKYMDADCDEEEGFEEIPTYEYQREEPLRIYPNPTTEYISVTDNSSVAYLYVYNIIGRRVKSFPVFGGGQYSLRDLPDGMYLIGLVDANGKIMKTVRTSKSVPRP